jgi:outer membrane protein OmpA-like peptidoglycan-associated protein
MTLTIGACCALLPQGGYGLQFINSMENSSWTPRSSSYSCILDHPITDFGHARFQHNAGEPVEFYLDSNRSIFRKGTAILASRAPNWRHQDGSIVLGEVETLPKHRVITVTETLATRMLSALEHGMIPTFDGNPWFSKAESVRVGLSSVGFQEAYSQYQACEKDLLMVNFDQVEKTRVLFKTGLSEISAGSVRRLLDVVTYCKTDERVTQIYVDGHTDSVGLKKDNVTISRSRAQAVTDHLVGLGLSPDMIVTRFHGEKYPVAANNTAANRTKNRRATVRLVRE